MGASMHDILNPYIIIALFMLRIHRQNCHIFRDNCRGMQLSLTISSSNTNPNPVSWIPLYCKNNEWYVHLDHEHLGSKQWVLMNPHPWQTWWFGFSQLKLWIGLSFHRLIFASSSFKLVYGDFLPTLFGLVWFGIQFSVEWYRNREPISC